MKTSRRLTLLTTILLSVSLLLTGCLGENSSLQQRALDALTAWNEQDDRYSVSGKLQSTYQNADVAEQVFNASLWQWNGNMDHHSANQHLELTIGSSEASNVLPLVYQDDHWHTRWSNDESVWFQFTNQTSALNMLNHPDPISQALASWIEQMDPSHIEAFDEHSIMVKMNAETANAFVAEWAESTDGVGEPFASLHDTITTTALTENDGDMGSVQFEIDENDQLTGYTIHFHSHDVQLEWQQQRSDYVKENEKDDFQFASIPDDATIIPFDRLIEKVDEIQNMQAVAEEIQFEQDISLVNTYAYPDGSDAAEIVALLNSHMQAVIDRDMEEHENLFRRPSFAEKHQELIQTDRKFQFLHIEDLNFKNFHDTVRVGVIYDFVDPGDIAVTSSAWWYTLNKDDNGEWKIDNIR